MDTMNSILEFLQFDLNILDFNVENNKHGLKVKRNSFTS